MIHFLVTSITSVLFYVHFMTSGLSIFFPPKFLKVWLILASSVIISNMSILYNMFHIFSFHIMFSFMKSNQAWLLCDHVCLPIFCLLHYFYSLLTLILCHSASKSLYPKIKLQEKAGGKKPLSFSWMILFAFPHNVNQFFNIAHRFYSLTVFLINKADEKSYMNVIV